MGLDGLLDIGKSALSAAQQALTVTGHNVANVNTPGYSRQEAVLTERSPINGTPGQVGCIFQQSSRCGSEPLRRHPPLGVVSQVRPPDQ